MNMTDTTIALRSVGTPSPSIPYITSLTSQNISPSLPLNLIFYPIRSRSSVTYKKEFLEQDSKQMKGGGDERSEFKKGLWTVEEDKILMDYIRVHGKGKWNRIPKITGLKRCGKSCRLRWMNYLSPGVKRGNFSEEEDDLIIRLHKLLGNRWSLIAGRVPGRTDNQVKNHWNTHLSKKLGVKKAKCKAIRTRSKLARVIRENLNTNAPSNSNDGPTSSCNDEAAGVGHVNVPDGASQNSTFEVSCSQGLMTSDCYDNSFWFSNDDITLYSTPGLIGILDEPLDFLWHGL